MEANKKQKQWERKAKIIAKFGSIAACCRALKCSDEAIRQTLNGKCPGVARKLEAALR